MAHATLFESSCRGSYHKSIQSSTTPDPGHQNGKVTKYRKHHIQESQEVSPFSAGDHKTTMNIQESMTNT